MYWIGLHMFQDCERERRMMSISILIQRKRDDELNIKREKEKYRYYRERVSSILSKASYLILDLVVVFNSTRLRFYFFNNIA